MKASYFHTITLIGKMLDKSNVPYQYTGQSALFVQGVEVDEYKNITIDVQWDVFNEVFELFSKFAPTQPEKILRVLLFYWRLMGLQSQFAVCLT